MCESCLLSLKLTKTFQGKQVWLKMRLSIAKIATCDCLDTLFIISNNYDGGLSRLMFGLTLYQVIKKRTEPNDDATRKSV